MTSLRRSKKRQNPVSKAHKREAPDPLGLSVNKRPSDDLSDRLCNDWLESLAIFLALVGMIGAGIALYYLSQQV
jgi:hypothetical protein